MDREDGESESLGSYSSIADFKRDLGEEALAHEEFESGWVLYKELLGQHRITALLKHLASMDPRVSLDTDLILQFWGVVKVEESHYYLSSSHHPFYISELNTGICSYMKLCRDHEYLRDDEQQLGAVGRVYRNRLPESTPDLRLYSTHEFPMRDEAARCGFRSYLALPLFEFDSHTHTHKCYGVLELFHGYYDLFLKNYILLSKLDQALQMVVGLRFNHNSTAIRDPTKEEQQPESETIEVLELVMATIPQIYLAQVWIPCNDQCVNISTNLCCMEIISSIDSQSKKFNSWLDIDDDMKTYLLACEFHKLQVDLCRYHSTLCGLTISENPMAHYVQKARMSHCIAVSHRSNSNQLYAIQFFLRTKYIQDGHSLHLLLRILETNLKSVRVMYVSGEQLQEEYARCGAIGNEPINSFRSMKSYKQYFQELNMTTFLKKIDSCCLIKPYFVGKEKGWVYRLPARSVCENHVKSNSALIKKMECFMRKIAVESWRHDKWIVQFWAPKMVKNRCYLETSDQPYAVGCLAMGIALYRKQCTENYYFVDDQAKQDELGPPGRVFRFKHPEISPDIIYYTRQEFPVRNAAMLCSKRGYLALPVFDVEDRRNRKFLGVLEFLGFDYYDLRYIVEPMKEEYLCSTYTTPIDFPRMFGNEPADIALTEIRRALFKINDELSQLHMTNVWVPIKKCVSTTTNNGSCMKLEYSTKAQYNCIPTNVNGIHIQARKGIVGIVMASENKSCFCPNSCELSIVDQPLSHYDMSDRRDACFAICLQSSYTGNLLYVVEFFLYQRPATYKYVRSFLSLLLPILKHKLSSFKMACGKQLGEELIVEVIEFSDANNLDSSELEPSSGYPVIFKRVQYNQNEYHHIAEEEEGGGGGGEEEEEEEEEEQCTIVASDSNTKEREKRKNSFNISYEVLKSHFHMKQKDAAKAIGVSLSTIKRASKKHGILRWPNNKKHKKNPSIFQEERAADSVQDMLPSTDKVIVKVKYNEDNIRFELSLSLVGLAKITEEVATSLNLEKGSFKLKYVDEDGEEILLTRDVDLQLCPKTQTATGEPLIRLLVRSQD